MYQGTDWQEEANCIETDPSLWFPEKLTKHPTPQIRLAKQICGECTVRAECLRYAISTESVGIWGGTDTNERHELMTKLRRVG